MNIGWSRAVEQLWSAPSGRGSEDMEALSQAATGVLDVHLEHLVEGEGPRFSRSDGIIFDHMVHDGPGARAEGLVWWIDQTTDPVELRFRADPPGKFHYELRCGDAGRGTFTIEELRRVRRRSPVAWDGNWVHRFSGSTTPEFVDAIKSLEILVRYFERAAPLDPAFEPERMLASRFLNAVDRAGPDCDEVGRVREEVGALPPDSHYNGSAWLDFKLRLGHIGGLACGGDVRPRSTTAR